MITKLKNLWQQAFGDTEEFLEHFFSVAYSPDRCRYLTVDGQLAAMLYWFDCTLGGRKLAYLYAVATDKAYQRQGLCKRLIAETHSHLQNRGYAGAILVPGSKELFSLYEKLGYRTCSYVTEFSCQAGTPVPLRPIDITQYAALRRTLLPEGSVVQEGAMLEFLSCFAKFYAGDGFVLAATTEKQTVHVHELLGAGDAPGITAALGAESGIFRTPGNSTPFAMYYGFTDAPAPAYFGLALD